MKRLTFLIISTLLACNTFAQNIFKLIERQEYVKLEKAVFNNSKIDNTNSDGITPLWKATLENDTISMKILLKNGANPNAPTKGGTTPIFISAENGNIELGKILYEFGADVNYNKNEYSLTPLRHAARNGYIDVVRFLLSKGAEINATAVDKATALSASCSKGHFDVAKLLIENGAIINIIDKDGDTPLINACFYGRYEIVTLLLENSADRTIKNKNGKTAIEIAKERGYPKIVELLIQ